MYDIFTLKTLFVDRPYHTLLARNQGSTGSVRDAPGMMHNTGSMHKTSPLRRCQPTSDQSPATRTGLNYLFLRKPLISILEPIAEFDAPTAKILVAPQRAPLLKITRKKFYRRITANYRIPSDCHEIVCDSAFVNIFRSAKHGYRLNVLFLVSYRALRNSECKASWVIKFMRWNKQVTVHVAGELILF